MKFGSREAAAAVCLVAMCLGGATPDAVQAACDVIPQAEKTFNSTLGATNRPFASPGESVEVHARPCDASSPGIAAAAASNIVTLVFTPTNSLAPRRAMILTAALNCAGIDTSACASQLPP